MPEAPIDPGQHGQVIENPDPNHGYVALDPATIITPFDAIDLNDLDAATADKVKKGIEDFKAQQVTNHKLQHQTTRMGALTRNFQSRADKMEAQLKKLTTPQPPAGGPSFKDESEKQAYDTLKGQGYSDEQITQHLPLVSNIIRTTVASTSKQLGDQFAPVAMQVLQQRNSTEFQQAAGDPAAQMAFADATIAQEVWDWVTQQSQAGQQVNAAVITNIAKLAWVDKTQAVGQNGNSQMRTPPANPMPFIPGLYNGGIPVHTSLSSTNQQKSIDPRVQAAVESVFKTIGTNSGVFPAAMKPATK